MAPIHNTIGDTSNGDDVRGGDGSGVGGGELMSIRSLKKRVEIVFAMKIVVLIIIEVLVAVGVGGCVRGCVCDDGNPGNKPIPFLLVWTYGMCSKYFHGAGNAIKLWKVRPF